jgi:hypothetical protein
MALPMKMTVTYVSRLTHDRRGTRRVPRRSQHFTLGGRQYAATMSATKTIVSVPLISPWPLVP